MGCHWVVFVSGNSYKAFTDTAGPSAGPIDMWAEEVSRDWQAVSTAHPDISITSIRRWIISPATIARRDEF